MHRITGDQANKESNFANILLDAFKYKSLDKFKHLNMDESDFDELITDLKLSALWENGNDELINQIKSIESAASFIYQNHFHSLIEEGEKIGIDWSQVIRDTFVYKVDNPGNSSKKILSGHLDFLSNNELYVFFGIEAVELSMGYKINTIKAVLKGSFKEYVNNGI